MKNLSNFFFISMLYLNFTYPHANSKHYLDSIARYFVVSYLRRFVPDLFISIIIKCVYSFIFIKKFLNTDSARCFVLTDQMA